MPTPINYRQRALLTTKLRQALTEGQALSEVGDSITRITYISGTEFIVRVASTGEQAIELAVKVSKVNS